MASKVTKMLFLLSFILLLDNVENAAVAKPTLGSIQLVDGTSSCSGRVEIYTDEWGTICDMDMTEGNMICMEVGCGPISAVKKNAFFGEGSGVLLTDDLNCFGNESLVIDCEWDNHTDECDHSNDVGVICDPTVRLQGGSGMCSGRVEIFHNRVWGTVSDNGWDMVDAAVVCEERGCGKPITLYSNAATFGAGTGQIWMDNLACTGHEASVEDCAFGGWGVVTGTHADDAGVACAEVALVDGDDACSGRVAILYPNWGWGTLCDTNWNLLGGDVICRELGCGSALHVTTGSTFKKGSGQIWTFNKDCTGTESYTKGCIAIGTPNSCNHNNEAGVVCRQVKLVNGPHKCIGTVAVRYNGDWGSVCYNNWDSMEGIVACRELGCGPFKQLYNGPTYGSGPGLVSLDGLLCTGSESSLRECPFPGINSLCTHSNDVGVSCGVVRLVDGNSACSGRVEVLYNGQWGTVCEDNWDINDAQVACREMGCGDAVEVKKGAFFGAGVGKIWMDKVNCKGTEGSLFNCPANPFGTNNCVHNQDAGVICREVRLVSANNNPCQGTVQVYHDEQWGSVCHNDWDAADGVVLCRDLGCGGNVQALPNAFFGQTTGKVWMDYVSCTSEESNLRYCKFSGWGKSTCTHTYDAGIVCKIIRNVIRIEVKASDVNPNSPTIQKQFLDKLKQEIQKMGNYTVNWRTQTNKQVFQEKSIFDS